MTYNTQNIMLWSQSWGRGQNGQNAYGAPNFLIGEPVPLGPPIPPPYLRFEDQ